MAVQLRYSDILKIQGVQPSVSDFSLLTPTPFRWTQPGITPRGLAPPTDRGRPMGRPEESHSPTGIYWAVQGDPNGEVPDYFQLQTKRSLASITNTELLGQI
jgi:hypothetical protein